MSVSGVNVETCRPEEGGRQLYLGVRQVSEQGCGVLALGVFSCSDSTSRGEAAGGRLMWLAWVRNRGGDLGV